MLTFLGAGTIYSVFTSKTLKLEGKDSGLPGAEYIDQRYLPSTMPLSIDQANDALRWQEASQNHDLGSGVTRTDSTQLPGNIPCEDEIFGASGRGEDGKVEWHLWAVFDGHAYVVEFEGGAAS